VTQPSTNTSFWRRIFPAQEPGPARFLRIRNTTRQTEIGANIEIADTAARRNRGLLGRTGLEQGEGLWIVPCEAVHTFSMSFPIDLIYLDRNRRVVKVRRDVAPARISGALRARSVVEVPSGAIAATQTQCGDILEFEFLTA
jgi:uncharacterized membrane protein (UPF0127 family)